jgi:rubrerythrin
VEDAVFTSEDLFEIAIQIDKNAEKIYRMAMTRATDKDLRTLLKWLVDEEARHLEWFSALRKKVDNLKGDPQIAEVGREILLETIGGLSFSLENADVSGIQKDMELLKVTIEFEKDKVQFFKMLRPFVEDREAQDDLERIIAEEQKHARQLQLCIREELNR